MLTFAMFEELISLFPKMFSSVGLAVYSGSNFPDGSSAENSQFLVQDLNGNLVPLPKKLCLTESSTSEAIPHVNFFDVHGSLISLPVDLVEGNLFHFLSDPVGYTPPPPFITLRTAEDVEVLLSSSVISKALTDSFVSLRDTKGDIVSVPKGLSVPANAQAVACLKFHDLAGNLVWLPETLFTGLSFLSITYFESL